MRRAAGALRMAALLKRVGDRAAKRYSAEGSEGFHAVGKPTHRLDTPSKTNGTAQFGLDVYIPGMLTAVVARSPVFGGKVASFNADKAKAIPGVVNVVEVPSGVAVIAKGFWPAKLGREKFEITWDDGPALRISTVEMREKFSAMSKTPGAGGAKSWRSRLLRLAGAAKTITAEYEVPYLAHCMMEPLNTVVDLHEDHCEIWTGSQFQTGDRAAAAKVAGLQARAGDAAHHTSGRRFRPRESCERFRDRSDAKLRKSRKLR